MEIAKKNRFIKILLIMLFVIVTIIIGISAYTYYILSEIKQTNINMQQDAPQKEYDALLYDYPIRNHIYTPASPVQKDNTITNIALFGLDRRGSEACRSDTMMIVSIDKENKKIKLTSLMRDMYINLPGRGNDRLNHAYAYGGPTLAMKTINSNLDMDIKYYTTIDFKGLEKIISKLGGVDINIRQGEIKYLNDCVRELNEIDKENIEPYIETPGMQHLTGKQAVSYMRIRYYGNGDFERTERQRTVLTQLLDKIKSYGVLKLPDLINTFIPYVETNLSKGDILSMGISVLSCSSNIDQYRLPLDGTFEYQTIRGMNVLVPDIETNKNKLHNFIYGDDEDSLPEVH